MNDCKHLLPDSSNTCVRCKETVWMLDGRPWPEYGKCDHREVKRFVSDAQWQWHCPECMERLVPDREVTEMQNDLDQTTELLNQMDKKLRAVCPHTADRARASDDPGDEYCEYCGKHDPDTQSVAHSRAK